MINGLSELKCWFQGNHLQNPKNIIFEFQNFSEATAVENAIQRAFPYTPYSPLEGGKLHFMGFDLAFKVVPPPPKCPCCKSNLKPGQILSKPPPSYWL